MCIAGMSLIDPKRPMFLKVLGDPLEDHPDPVSKLERTRSDCLARQDWWAQQYKDCIRVADRDECDAAYWGT